MAVSKLNNRLTQISNVKYAKGLFDAHKTNTPLDGLFSIDGGVPKATNWMVVGDPGVGKSTVTLDIIANAKKSGSKVLFISAEMNQVDLYLYVQRYPKFGELDIFFPQDIADDEDPRKVLNAILDEGYDLVLIDSFVELQETIREHAKMTRNGSEKWLLDMMYKQNLGQNKGKKFTSFLNIQQVNKGGTFVGSNKLKHMTTGMMEIRFVDERTQDERYVVFSKNRRGHVGKQMFFDLSAAGDVTYDTERFKKAESLKQLKKKEKELVKKDGLEFDKLFGLKDEVSE
ncbi:MAG: ATPase domain-containing protein [Bacteroidota bacterium]|jgi:DNA repair protein RadA/Sms|nr:ATPase domain-containing protein [Bacteroidota bacterium]